MRKKFPSHRMVAVNQHKPAAVATAADAAAAAAVVVAGAFDDASADAEAIGGLLNEDRRQPAFHNHLPSGF